MTLNGVIAVTSRDVTELGTSFGANYVKVAEHSPKVCNKNVAEILVFGIIIYDRGCALLSYFFSISENISQNNLINTDKQLTTSK